MVRNSETQTENPDQVSLTRSGVFKGIQRLLPVSLFILPFGLAFGVAATEQGLHPYQATLMSMLVFTAIAQFAALDFLNQPIAYFSLALVVLALSGRHVIMSAALAKWLNRLPAGQKYFVLAFLSDPNFADAQRQISKGERDMGPLLGGGLILWFAWVASTALGAYGGDLLGNTEIYGFGAVMLCFFAATAFDMVRESRHLLAPVLVALLISALTYPILPTGWNIILAALAGGFVSMVRKNG